MLYVLRDDVQLVLALMLRAFPGPDDAATPYVSDAALAAQASSIEIPPAFAWTEAFTPCPGVQHVYHTTVCT